MNRNPNKQAGEFEGREINPINVDLGTEYWLTRAGRGKAKDIFEDAGRSVEGIKRVLTHRDEDTGEYDFAGNVLSESITRRLIDRGFIVGKGKKIEQIAKEIESRYGDMTRKGIKVRFYGEEDVDTTNLTEDQLRKLEANGIATTGDGYIWINKEKIKDGDTIDFNKVVSHELTHQILGKDTEYQARYVEGTYGDHLQGIKNNGYLKDGQILDLMMSSLTDEDRARLNKYVDDDMEFKIFLDKKLSDADRKRVLRTIQELTNNLLKIERTCPLKDCYEIVFDKTKDNKLKKLRAKDFGKSDKLILDLIATKKEVWVTNEKDPSKFFNNGEPVNQHIFKNGKSYVMISYTQESINRQIPVLINGKVRTPIRPLYIGAGHEFLHSHHYIFNPTKRGSDKKYTAIDPNGKLKKYSAPEEEIRTVGIPKIGFEEDLKNLDKKYRNGPFLYHRANDITENDLRREHGLPYRVYY